MHCKCKVGVNSDNNIVKNKASAVGFNLNANNLLVFKTILFSISRSCMDVSLCGNNAAIDCNFTLGANKLASACVCDIAAFSYGCNNTDAASICE